MANITSPRRIVLPGGSGHVGRLLAKRLHEQGDDVTVLSRSVQSEPWRVLQWDGRTLGEWRQAEAALRRALAIRELKLGQLHADVAQTIDTLARLLFATKRYAEAELLYKRSLEIWTHLLGPGNSVLAMSYDNLAVTEAALRKYVEAETLYVQAMVLRDEDDMGSLRNLALVRVAKGNYKDAEPLFKRALATMDAPYNRYSAQLPDLPRDYADMLRQVGRNSEAAKLEARLKATRQTAETGEPGGKL